MSALAEAVTYGIGEFLRLAIPAVIEYVSESAKEVKAIEEEESIAINEINHSEYTEDTISKDLDGEITRLANGSATSRTCYRACAKYSNKWINFAYYYMTVDDAYLLSACKDDKELVNGISDLAGFGKIYAGYDNADLKKYDAESVKAGYSGHHLILLRDIKKVIENEDFQVKMADRLDKVRKSTTSSMCITGPVLNIKNGARVDNDGLYHPIFTSGQPIEFEKPEVKGEGISDELFNRIEEGILKLLPLNKYHYIRKEGNLLKLYIETDPIYHATENFVIDDGSIMSGKDIYVLGKYQTENGSEDTIFVNCRKHPEIVRYILSSVFNYMSADMVSDCMNDQFSNGRIYHNIDFSNTGFIDDMSAVDKIILERNLSAVTLTMDNDERLRFMYYNSPSSFALVSDNSVSSPLSSTGATSSTIIDGLTYIIAEDEISKYRNGQLYGKYKVESGN